MFIEAFEGFLSGSCTPAAVRAIEAGGAHDKLWQAISGTGFLELMGAEEQGGAHLDLAETLPLISLLGAHAVPLPVGQAIALRSMLAPGDRVPEGVLTFAPAIVRQIKGGLLAPRVPFGAIAEHVVAELDGEIWLMDARIAERVTIETARDTTADLHWPKNIQGLGSQGAARLISRNGEAGSLGAWGAALHAALMVGALGRCFELSLQYCNDRAQFGKSIGKFQAIQHQLAVMAEHVAAARAAVAGAFPVGERRPGWLPAAIAKARASEAVTVVTSIAHAVHGAIGVTEEYDLQLFTRRLHTWRVAHGSEAYWHGVIGSALLNSADRTTDFVRMLAEQ